MSKQKNKIICMHYNLVKQSGYVLIEYLLCLAISILLSTLISALFLQAQKTIMIIKEHVRQQQEIMLFKHYFSQTISIAGIYGMTYSNNLLSVQTNWHFLNAGQEPQNWSGGNILDIQGTSALNSDVLFYSQNGKIELESNDPFYQEEDHVLLSDGSGQEVYQIHSVNHYYPLDKQVLRVNRKIAFPQGEKILAYQTYHNIYYLGKLADGKNGLFVMHENERRELLMPFVSNWSVRIVTKGSRKEAYMRVLFNNKKVILFIFGTDNEKL